MHTYSLPSKLQAINKIVKHSHFWFTSSFLSGVLHPLHLRNNHTTPGQDTLLDYKELPDAQLGHGKLARWHHAHAFVDLRRLLAPCKGPELEFRAYLTQVDTAMPGEFPESEWPAAYQPCRSYVKGGAGWNWHDFGIKLWTCFFRAMKVDEVTP